MGSEAEVTTWRDIQNIIEEIQKQTQKLLYLSMIFTGILTAMLLIIILGS